MKRFLTAMFITCLFVALVWAARPAPAEPAKPRIAFSVTYESHGLKPSGAILVGWDDGLVVFAINPDEPGTELQFGKLTQAQIVSVINDLKSAGFFEQQMAPGTVPDTSCTSITASCKESLASHTWNESRSFPWGSNIESDPSFKNFTRMWSISRNALAFAHPRVGKPLATDSAAAKRFEEARITYWRADAPVVALTKYEEPPVATDPPLEVRISHPGPKFVLAGRLGRPIGETVTLQGVVVEGPSKGYDGGPNVIVQRINGQATQQFLRIPITPYFGDWGSKGGDRKVPLPNLTMGASFELQGYETGRYVGIPEDAFQLAGIMIQTAVGQYFHSEVMVITGAAIEPIHYAPSEFIDREALIEGVARNKNGHALIVGDHWEVVLDGPKWLSTSESKPVEAFGVVRKLVDGSFRIESGAESYHGLTKLEDQINSEVSLRGTGFCFNALPTFEYRGTQIGISNLRGPANANWPHGEAALVSGRLEKLNQPETDKNGNSYIYAIRSGTWKAADPLLIPEVDVMNVMKYKR